jgi:hypothetical protein
MERFRLKGIVSPGRVNLPKVGTVELASLSDEQAEKLWREGCPYLEPAPDIYKLKQPLKKAKRR